MTGVQTCALPIFLILLLRFTNIKLSDENLVMSRSVQQSDETIFSSGVSCVMVPDELNELVQYSSPYSSFYLLIILFICLLIDLVISLNHTF